MVALCDIISMTNQQKLAEMYLKEIELNEGYLEQENRVNRARTALAQSLDVHEMAIVNALDGFCMLTISTNTFLRRVAECEKIRLLNEWIKD